MYSPCRTLEKNIVAYYRRSAKGSSYVKKDGSQVWVNLSASLMRSPSGEPS